MSNYELQIKQVVDYPLCRIYRQFVQSLIKDRNIRLNGGSGLFYYTVLCSYANFRVSYRHIDGIRHVVNPGEWIVTVKELSGLLRTRFQHQVYSILDELQEHHLISYSTMARNKINVPFVSYTASVANEGTPDGSYAEKAQNEAVDNALSDAGFGIQIADRYYGSEVPVSAYPGTSPKAVHRPASKPVQTSVKAVVQPPAVAEQTVPAAQVKTEVSTAQTAAQTGVQTVTKAEPVVTPKVEAKAEPIAQEVPAVKAEPVQPVIAPEAKPALEAHAANAALELLRGGSAQPAAAQATPAQKDGSDLPFTFGPTYNNEMSVEQIVGIMTLEQAKKVVVDDGMSKGMTMGEVAEKRPASLQFYLSVGYKKNNNILKAAAQILLNERKKAS